MKKIILPFILLASIGLSAQVGVSKKVASNSKWTFGGYAGLTGGFGSYSGFTINVTPRVGYKVSENLEAGLSGSFNWQNSSYSSSTLFGLGPFANYYFGRNFFLTSQFQEYVITEKIKSTGDKLGYDEAALYIGAGYLQRLGSGSYMQIGAMYNVLWKENNSIFSSGFVPSIGVVFGL